MPETSTTHPLNALPIGHVLQGEYRIEQVLGAGGFGITYLATDGFGRPVAIKEYLPNELAVRVGGATQVSARAAQDADDLQWGLRKFREEGAKLAAFDHPHINRVLRLFEANGTAYLVLEYVHGHTLSQVLAQGGGRLEQAPLQRLLTELLQALQVVHGAGLVHCDIKPANIMLREEDGAAVLLDFGASRLAVSQRTRSVMSAFTPPYAAIEQYGSSPKLGAWTDLYALGMVAYRCITGRKEAELLDSVSRLLQPQQDIEPVARLGAGRYPEGLLQAVDWALAVQEAQRPQSAQALARAVGVTLEQAGQLPLPPPPPPPPAPPRWKLAAVAILFCAAIALIAVGPVVFAPSAVPDTESHEDIVAIWSSKILWDSPEKRRKFSALTDLAEGGSAEAMNLLGIAYQYGLGGQKADLELAIHWYTRGHEAGSRNATAGLALMYMHTDSPLPVNLQELLTLTTEAAQGGSPRGLFNLGALYDQGSRDINLPVDKIKSQQLIRDAAAAGWPIAMTELGYNERDPEIRTIWLTRAANAGDPVAMCMLGEDQLNNAIGGADGSQPDRSQILQALSWMKSSAESGFSNAMWRLVELYEAGIPGVVEADPSQVARWKTLAEGGDGPGFFKRRSGGYITLGYPSCFSG